MTKKSVNPDKAGKKQEIPRNPDGTFPKGVSGNPAGYLKGQKNFTTMVREALEKIATGEGKNVTTYYELLVKRVLKKAIEDGDVQMIREFWRQHDGAPAQKVELSGGVATGRRFGADQMRRVAEEVIRAQKDK